MEKFFALKNASLFNELSSSELKLIENISISKNFKKGEHIFFQGDPLVNVYFIQEGLVKVYRNDANGREQIVSILSKDELFPHIGFFRDGTYPAFAQAIEQTKMIRIPKNRFEEILIANPELCVKLFKVLGEKIIDLQTRLEAQILNNTYEQIIKLLIRLGESHGKNMKDGKVYLDVNVTNQDLAKMIGTSRESISRTFSKLKKQKLLFEEKSGYSFYPEGLLKELLQ
ncbi:Crp/Fnr family transcriptional regulator [Peribacillus tepidiphilus]|uniref:Crp/Fnr family transcriptional regulator n=1 Tax=Peribacillus tepidiphilus TaxID=2652445 RepID=UPI0012910E13|nr:Crp/Fnr family transcriptional regulator [Peribacillus tepidiphilus]